MAFHDVRFPTKLSFGATGGPERRTEIVTLSNGFEERNAPWQHSRRRYDAGVGLRSLADLELLIAFFEERRGQLHGFRWKDWADYRSGPADRAPAMLDQLIGTGDGKSVRFELSKTYGTGETAYRRPISKPVYETVRVALDGVAIEPGSGVEIRYDSGELVFETPPSPGANVTAGYEFDVPVRFDMDRIDVSIDTFNAGQVPGIPVVEVRL